MLVDTLFQPQAWFFQRLVRREGSILSLKSVDKGINFQKKNPERRVNFCLNEEKYCLCGLNLGNFSLIQGQIFIKFPYTRVIFWPCICRREGSFFDFWMEHPYPKFSKCSPRGWIKISLLLVTYNVLQVSIIFGIYKTKQKRYVE